MSKPKNVSEVLEKFRKECIAESLVEEPQKPWDRFLRTAISELLDGVVPEIRGGCGHTLSTVSFDNSHSRNNGYDDCRSEVVRRVEEAKK